MTLKHIVATMTAIFATGALAAGDPSHQRPSQGAGSGAEATQAQSGSQSQSPEVVRQVQQQLNSKGYEVGAVDGQLGPKTTEGVKKFQEAQNLSPTGRIDRQTLAALGVGSQGSSGSSSPASSSRGGTGSPGGSSTGGAMSQPGSGPGQSGGPDRVIQ